MKWMLKFGTLVVLAVAAVAKHDAAAVESGQKEFSLAVSLEVQPLLVAYLKARQAQTKELASKYARVIDAQLAKAADAGDLKTAEAFQGEKKGLDALDNAFTKELENPALGAREGAALPGLGASAPEALVALRKIWMTEWLKIRTNLDGELQQSLKKLETDLTKARDFKNTKEILVYRELLLSSSPVATATAKDAEKTASPAPVIKGGASASATVENPFENSLGMRFVPVPIIGGPSDGKPLLFSIWETRVGDYEAFIKKNRNREWKEVDFKQKNDHPAVNMSWDDAVEFCVWLTSLEQEKDLLGKDERYRLPTDHEWSCALGIGVKEKPEESPKDKNGKFADVYPWGKEWPPPSGAGNYCGEETKAITARPPIVGYTDDFLRTAPVGSFTANEFGLFDLSGNVWEWCQDWFDPDTATERVLRGLSWSISTRSRFLSSYRVGRAPTSISDGTGFRCVIEKLDSKKKMPGQSN